MKITHGKIIKYVRIGVLCLLCISGCTTRTPTTAEKTGTAPAPVLVEFFTPASIPYDPAQTPRTHLGYGVSLAGGRGIITARHLIPDDLAQLIVATDDREYIINQVRHHPRLDLSVLQTTPPIPAQTSIAQVGSTQGWWYTSGGTIRESLTLEGHSETTTFLLSGQIHVPGMSGMPVFDHENRLLGIISRQVAAGTEGIRLDKQLIDRIMSVTSQGG